MITDKRVRRGRQVYLDYEAFPSHHYLAHYGFVPLSNIHDCLLVPLPNASFTPLLREVLTALGFPSDDSMCLDVTRFMNDKALAFFLLRDASDAQLRRCLAIYRDVVVGRQNGRWEATDVYECALGAKDRLKERWDERKEGLRKQLYTHLRFIEQFYSTSIAADNVRIHRRLTTSFDSTQNAVGSLLPRSWL